MVMPEAGPVAERVLAEVTDLAAVQRRMEMVLKVIQQEVQGIAGQLAATPGPTAAKAPVAPAKLSLGTRSFRQVNSRNSGGSETSNPMASRSRWEVLDRGEENDVLSVPRSEDTAPDTTSSTLWPVSVQIRQGLLRVWSDDGQRMRPRLSINTGASEMIPDDSSSRCVLRGMVNPNSSFHFGYNLLLLVVLFHDLTFIPVILAWEIPVKGWLLKVACFSCAFWSVDLVMNFVTGFYQKGRLVTACRQVALRYLRGGFVPDSLMVICDWMSLAIATTPSEASLTIRMLRVMKVGKLLRIAGLFRAAKIASVLVDILERNLSETVRLSLKCASLVMGTLLLNHLIGCTWFAIGRLAHADTGMRWVDHSRVLDGVELDFLSTDGVYQWVTAMHWSMAQITLGSIEFSCYNSIERSFTIISMAIGVVFSSTLVSSLSASMVDYQLIVKDRREKIKRLRRFLREKRVATKIARLVLQQANERVNTSESLREEDVHVLPLLPKTLRAQLRFELFQDHLKSHPLFNLWSCFDLPTVQWICMEAVGVVDLSPEDDLFTEGTPSSRAYYLSRGRLTYSRDSAADDADATENTEVTAVNVASWMSEASLWLHWTHVGTAKATTKCEVISISADDLVRVLSRSRILLDMVQTYCQVYHECVVKAKARDDVQLSDLLVPDTSFPDMMLAMDFGTQGMLSLQTMEYVKLTQWLSSFSTVAKGRLQTEIGKGMCCVVMNSNQAERLVGQVLLLLTNQRNKILVEFSRARQDGQKPTFWLPGVKPIPGEPPECSAVRLLEHMCIRESDVEYVTMKRIEEVKNLPGYGMPTRFVKRTHHMSLKEDLTFPCVTLRTSMFSSGFSGYSKSSASSGGIRSILSRMGRTARTPTPQSEVTPTPVDLGRELERTIYLRRETGSFYIWLSPEQFKYLHTYIGQQDWAAWVEHLHLDGINDDGEDGLANAAQFLSERS